MSRKHKHKNDHILKPITMEEATALACGKIIYQLGTVEDRETGKTIGKSLMFYERDKPEEQAKHWDLIFFDDGRLMVNEW